VRMGNWPSRLAQVNGVAALHTDLMKQTVFRDLHRLYPGRINNKTNGITPRRWLLQCNPGLTAVIEAAGDGVSRRCRKSWSRAAPLPAMPPSANASRRSSAPTRWLANLVNARTGVRVDPDRAVRRADQAHPRIQAPAAEHGRDVALYDQIRSHPESDWAPRVKIFAGKAAPSYHNAKLIIKLINDVAA
jgi:glycogen phosphorylase